MKSELTLRWAVAHSWLRCFAIFSVAPFTLAAKNAKALAKPMSGKTRVAFVTIATDDYFAQGAFVTLHSLALHSNKLEDDSFDVESVLMVSEPGISRMWRKRFQALGIKVVDVGEVVPSKDVRVAMEYERQQLAQDGLLNMLQPVPYGGAFAKIHAWDTKIFGQYEKVVLVDGDIVAKRSVRGLLEMEPLTASRDLMDAFNYGVLVLRPDANIYADLLHLLERGTKQDITKYSTRGPKDAGFCDQTLVAGFLAANFGPISFFDDLRGQSLVEPQRWLLSTEYNFVVSYRAKERCDRSEEREWIDKARVVHFANNWLNFNALSEDRNATGRIDSPRCYQGAFWYWHDMLQHGLASVAAVREKKLVSEKPVYVATGRMTFDVDPEKVQKTFYKFNQMRAVSDLEL